MARRGHVSVTIDRLGYGDSDKPTATASASARADVLHQIVGSYGTGLHR